VEKPFWLAQLFFTRLEPDHGAIHSGSFMDRAILSSYRPRPRLLKPRADKQKFFGSFFQKRTAFFLALPHQ
jgi:hypothetical protein